MNIIVLDLEFTCPTRQDVQITEIIEIGAVCVDDVSFTSLSTFSTLVEPTLNPYLSQVCTELTHIEQDDLNDAPQFEEALQSFMDWLNKQGDYKIYAWGVSDRQQLYKEVKKKCGQHPIIELVSDMRDLQRLYMEKNKIKDRFYSLSNALAKQNIEREEPAHRALSDAISTAKLLAYV